jgi:uroporphyrin-III C-methyltransferase
MKGKVYLVGAGPGDPELLTVKALRLLRSADAVLHDDLVGPEILNLIPSTAQIHSVGKRCGKKKILQQEINFLMVALAESGLRVVRLKSGDPLIFGRAGEEIEALRKSGVPYEIVPGVTSAFGAASAAQIPLTHRRASSAVVFLTAHQAAESEAANWSKLASSGATLIIYMPGQNYRELASKLQTAGLSSETPCAIISRASTRQQRTHVTKVGNLPQSTQLAAPTLVVVGDVVRFADRRFASPAVVAQEFLVPAADNATQRAKFFADAPAIPEIETLHNESNEETIA